MSPLATIALLIPGALSTFGRNCEGIRSLLRIVAEASVRGFTARRPLQVAVACILLASCSTAAWAQDQQPEPQSHEMPDGSSLVILIKTSLIALNQANLTGDYSVFRDLAAPGFQSNNSPLKLAEAFTDLRRRNINLNPIIVYEPKLLRQPAFDSAGMLKLSGFFETAPESVRFDLAFQFVGGQWRLFGISVDTVPLVAQQPAATPRQQPVAKPAAAKTKTKAVAKPKAAAPAADDPGWAGNSDGNQD